MVFAKAPAQICVKYVFVCVGGGVCMCVCV